MRLEVSVSRILSAPAWSDVVFPLSTERAVSTDV